VSSASPSPGDDLGQEGAEPSAPAGGLTLGLMQVGACLLALPAASIREVISCPAVLAPLPASAPGLAGAVRLRGAIIPVLDLAEVLALGRSPSPGVIVVMRREGRLLGLRACAVQGIATVGAAQLQAFGPPSSGSGPVTHTLEQGSDIVSLLCPERLAALPGVLLVDEPRTPAAAALSQRAPYLLFASRGHDLAIAAQAVDATVPATAIKPSAMASGCCLGVVAHHGRDVPVVDTLAALGLARARPAAQSALIVVRFPGGGLVGLTVDAVRDIALVAPQDVAAMPALAVPRPSLFAGVLQVEGSRSLVLAPAGLHDDAALATFARLSGEQISAADRRAAREAGGGAQVLAYVAGLDLATPLLQCSEILPFPADVTRIEGHQAGMLGLFMHRGTAVPLVDLAASLGLAARREGGGRVILVRRGAAVVGFAVEELRAIETARLKASAHGDPGGGSPARPSLASLVEIGEGAAARMVPCMDLATLADRLLDPAPSASMPVARRDAA
jgi:purine-binding chemotaxis protein CheW